MKKAIYDRHLLKNVMGDMILYKMEPPINGCDYVIVSNFPERTLVEGNILPEEVVIFASDQKGACRDWIPIAHIQHTQNHAKAFKQLNYEMEVKSK